MKTLFLLSSSTLLLANGWTNEPPLAINQPVNPWADHSNLIWARVDALLWQAIEDNLPSTTLHFDWDWGYRIAVGYQMPYDGWDIQLQYTHCDNHAEGKNRSVIPEASSKWEADLDQFDLNAGRSYYVGKYCTFRPNGGLRTTWLFQKYTIQELSLKNRFWGFGLTSGFDTDWLLGCGFSLFGQFDYALLIGFFDVNQEQHQLLKIKKSFRTGKSIIDTTLGIKWARLFSKNQYGITLRAGYDYHLYFNQNQFVTQNGNGLKFFSTNAGNLIYQGVTFSGQFNF